LKIPKGGNPNSYIEEEQTTQKSTKVQKDKQRSTNHIHKTKDRITFIRYSQSQIFYKYLGARKPKSLNRIAKIAYVLLCLREENFSFNNNNMI
jgi:hypothetical protein